MHYVQRSCQLPALSTTRIVEYLACHQFRVLLKYHDPEIEIHLQNYMKTGPILRRSFRFSLSLQGIRSTVMFWLLHLWDYLRLEADPNFAVSDSCIDNLQSQGFLSCTSRELLQEEARKLYKIVTQATGSATSYVQRQT